MQLVVKELLSKTHHIEVDPSDTVSWAKMLLYERLGLDPGNAKLIRHTQPRYTMLLDAMTFADFHEGEEITLVVGLGRHYKLPGRKLDEPLSEQQMQELHEEYVRTQLA